MTHTPNPECTVCLGTGEDLDFGGTCSMCDGWIPRRGGITEPARTLPTGGTARSTTATAATDDDWKRHPRWTKMGDQFMVVIPKGYRVDGKAVKSGDTVQVRSKSGEKPVTLGVDYAPDRYGNLLYWPVRDAEHARLVDAPAPVARPSAREAVGEGFYLKDDTVYRVVTGRNGRYAKALVGERFEYAAGAIKTLTDADRVTAEVAAAYGHRTHHCIFCGAELENQDSIDRGIGPVCYRKYC